MRAVDAPPDQPTAEWIPLPYGEDPFGLRRRKRSRYLAVAAGITSLLLVDWLALGWGGPSGSPVAFLLLLGLGSLVLIQFLFSRRTGANLPDALRFPTRDQAFATRVKLEIIQDGAVTGVDWGWFWVQELAVFFAGARCSFVISGSDIDHSSRWAKKLEAFTATEAGAVDVFCRGTARQTRVRFNVCFPDALPSRTADLRESVREIAGGKSDWRTVLPPLTLGAGIDPTLYDADIVLLSAVAVLLLAGFAATEVGAELFPPVVLITLAIGWFGVRPLILRRRILNEIARLRPQNPGTFARQGP